MKRLDNFVNKIIPMKKRLSVLLLLFTSFTYGQQGRMFTIDKELSNSIINNIYQDKKGNIWMATEDGLNRYDGAKFTVFKHEDGDVHSLIDDNVCTVYEDYKGHFLVGTIRGLQLYDPSTDVFTEIPIFDKIGNNLNMNAHITKILERKNGELLVATSGHGIFSLKFKNNYPEITEMNMSIPNLFIANIFEDREENLWISTEGRGLFRLSKTKELYKYFCDKKATWDIITSICQDEKGSIYAGSMSKGIFIYDRKRDSFYPMSYHDNLTLPVRILYPVGKNEIYIGTAGCGIKICDTRTGEMKGGGTNFATFDFEKSEVRTIMKDRIGNIWLGVNTKGVMLLPAITNAFKYLGCKSLIGSKIGLNSIVSVCEDYNGSLWLGAANDGLYCLGSDGKLKKHFEHSDSPYSVPSNVASVYEDSKRNIWLGSTSDGMAQMDPQTGKCKYIVLLDNKANNVKRIWCFEEDHSKRLWIASLGGGLFYMDLETGKITRCKVPLSGKVYKSNVNFLHNRWINCLLCTSNEKLYIGTCDGLGCLDLKTMNFVSTYKKNRLFSGSMIYALYQDYRGDIWIGTSKGLIMLNEKTGNSRTYTTKDGLPNNVICAIKGDKNKNLWLSTNCGISRLNLSDNTFINYYASDGLQGNEFSKGAAFQDKKGNLIFGGINGITYFDPRKITIPVKKIEVRITDFYLNNKSVKKGMTSGGREIVNEAVTDADKFHLCYKDNSFSIEFSTMEFYNPERITFMYSLNDANWISLRPGINKVSFSNLSPGTYCFSVKAKDYMTYSDVKEIFITISPAWYASIWAKFVYFILFLLVACFVALQLRHRYKAHQEILQHIHAEQINEAKLQFFINISHEIRTPMTLIISPLEKLIAENSPKQATYLMIYRNAQRILRLINQLMDIRKIDKGQMSLVFHETDIISFVKDLCDTFEQQANAKSIQLQIHHEIPDLAVWIDPSNFDKVILNILSNAFKFTPEQGQIDVYIQTGEDKKRSDPLRHYVEIIIADNGIGIEEKEMVHIFERFYQIRNSLNNSNIGTGIGLHLTRSLVELHHGTVYALNNVDKPGCRFIIRLPLGNAHLLPEEMESSEFRELDPLNNMQPALLESDIETGNKIKAKSKYSVLVVEDDEEIRKYICDELANQFHMLESGNGKDAFALILKKAPDLVISDVMMPEMDGFTLCRKIKQNVTINHVPVILLTAKTREEDNVEGLDMGADAYMVKPFSIDVLQKTVESIIKNRESLRNTFGGQQDQADKLQKIEAKSPDDKLLERVMKVINNNISNPDLTVEMITEQVGISRVHLHRKMKELTNQTTRDFIRNVRLRQAASLLATKHHNVTEVATLTGFTNANYFAVVFKEMYGVSPTTYMEEHLCNKQ